MKTHTSMPLKLKLFLFLKRALKEVFYLASKPLGVNNHIVSVLCYHNISENKESKMSVTRDNFILQIKKIISRARCVSLDEIVAVAKGKDISKPAVAITFDDGYAGILQVAPILKNLHVPATVFVLSCPEELGRKEPQHQERFLTTEEIRSLHNLGWIIGCHSATHPDLSSLSPEELEKEIIESKQSLETSLGITIKYFAYPKGYYNETVIRSVKKAGYEAAFTIEPGCVTKKTTSFKIPRTIIERYHHAREFPSAYSPSSFFLRKLFPENNLWDRIVK